MKKRNFNGWEVQDEKISIFGTVRIFNLQEVEEGFEAYFNPKLLKYKKGYKAKISKCGNYIEVMLGLDIVEMVSFNSLRFIKFGNSEKLSTVYKEGYVIYYTTDTCSQDLIRLLNGEKPEQYSNACFCKISENYVGKEVKQIGMSNYKESFAEDDYYVFDLEGNTIEHQLTYPLRKPEEEKCKK